MPDLPDDTVVAIFGDGTKFTMGEFRSIYAAMPPANQQMHCGIANSGCISGNCCAI